MDALVEAGRRFRWRERPRAAIHGHLFADGAPGVPMSRAATVASSPEDRRGLLSLLRRFPYPAHRDGVRFRVLVDRTGPRDQGARLTAWELGQDGIDHRIIEDSASGHLMARGEIRMVIVGADRIAANGDVANKIGTYMVALAAREHGVPFYVAAPWETFDPACPTGRDIPIEARDSDEVLHRTGPDEVGTLRRIRVAAPGSGALSPAFDVTPARLVSGYLTPSGMLPAGELAARFGRDF